jgi:hypothetical protein
MALAIAFATTGVGPARAASRPESLQIESTFKGLTALFTDCPVPPQPATCIGYSVNARNLSEEVGEREYHDELVWVDAAAVTIDATGIHISPDPLMTSRTDNNPPRFGGVPARVRIDGATSGRVRATVTLRGTDGRVHHAKLDVRVVGGVVEPFAFDRSFNVLCSPGPATGRGTGVFSDPATTGGTMTVDGVALTPVPGTIPGVGSAQLNTSRFAGTCDAAAAPSGGVLASASPGATGRSE